mgnify:CR=1 FL=1
MTQGKGGERLLRLRLAGVPVQVVSRFGMLEQVGEPYLEECADDEPLFTIRANDGDLAFDRAMAPEYPDPYVELCTVHRLIAEKVALLRRVVFHSCVIEYEGRAYAFTARSGTGKSTHARLWMRYLGDRGATILNGDKPFLYVPEHGGGPLVYGCPWAGKEGWGYNGSAPLAGICVLRQAPTCSIERLTPADASEIIVRQCHIPRESPVGALTVLACIDRVLADVPVWAMGCDISETAVKTSFEAMTGRSYADVVREQ